jgi:hypothetical protein
MASVQRRPDGRWRARYRDTADKKHARHFTRKADAERWLDEIRSDLLRGTYVDPAAGRVLFADFARTWLEAQPHRAGTALLYERTLRLHVCPASETVRWRLSAAPTARPSSPAPRSTWRQRRWRTTSASSRRYSTPLSRTS